MKEVILVTADRNLIDRMLAEYPSELLNISYLKTPSNEKFARFDGLDYKTLEDFLTDDDKSYDIFAYNCGKFLVLKSRRGEEISLMA